MKIASVLALVLSTVINTSASALEINQSDVNQGQAQGPQLSRLEQNKLKAKIVGYKVLLAQIKWHRQALNAFGLEERRGTGPFTLATTVGVLEVIGGVKVIEAMPQVADRIFIAKTDAIYMELERIEARMAEKEAKLAALKSAPVAEQSLIEITNAEAAVSAERALIVNAGERITGERIGASRALRYARNAATLTGATLGVALIADGVIMGYNLIIAPEQLEQTEANLVKYIDDAKATLRARR